MPSVSDFAGKELPWPAVPPNTQFFDRCKRHRPHETLLCGTLVDAGLSQVKSEHHVADLGTEALSRAVIAGDAEALGYVNMQRSQPGSNGSSRQQQGSDHGNANVLGRTKLWTERG